jgi:hypothetical protein
MSSHVRWSAWSSGGEAWVVSISASAIVLRSTVPSPPGSRVEGVLSDGVPGALRVKVHGCKRSPEGDFVLEGRPLDLTRGMRQRLEAIVGRAGV